MTKLLRSLFSSYTRPQENLALFAAIFAILLTTLAVDTLLEQRTKAITENTLTTILKSSAKTLNTRKTIELQLVQNLAARQDIVEATESLLAEAPEAGALQTSAAQQRIRELITQQTKNEKYRGFFIIGPDNLSVASSRDSNIGTTNLLVNDPDTLTALWSGESRVSHLLFSDVSLSERGPSGAKVKDLSLFSGAPIRDADGRVIALLTLRLDPAKTLFALLARNRLGLSGETYMFNAQGVMLNESRFQDQLVAIGLLQTGESSALRLALNDPGTDLTKPGATPLEGQRPLTLMAQSALSGVNGTNLEGYRDYRGVRVAGAWRWNPLLGLGIATKQDMAEVFAMLHLYQKFLYSSAAAMILILLLFYYISASGRRRLRMAQLSMTAIFRSALDGIVVIDKQGRIENINGAIERLFGYSRQDLLGRNVSFLMPEPHKRRHDQYLENYLQSGHAKVIGIGREVEAQRADGTLFPIELSVSRLPLEDGLRFTGTIHDISARKEAEALVEQEQNFTRMVLNSLTDQVAVLDQSGQIIFTNHAGREINAQPGETAAEDDLGHSFIDQVRRKAAEGTKEAVVLHQRLGALFNGELDYFSEEYPQGVTAQGKSRWFRVRGTILPHANKTDVLLSRTEITERVHSEQSAIQEKEAAEAANHALLLTQKVLERTGIAEYWIDADSGHFLRVNDEACRFLGYSRDALLNMTVMDITPELERAHFQQCAREAQRHGWDRFETSSRSRDGRTVAVEVTLTYQQAMASAGRTSDILVVFSLDISERIAARADLIHAHEEAEQASRAKSAFLATMSHEIRTPLNGVVGMVDVLAHTHLDEKQSELITLIQDSSSILVHVIDDILDFSKIEAGGLKLESAPVSLESTIESVGESLYQLAVKKDIDLLLYCDPDIPPVAGDPVRLQQVLYNLAGNAIKFTNTTAERDGRVEILVQLDKRDKKQAHIYLQVRDNGIGMTDDVRQRLFQPFSQGEASTTRRFGGTGLGLVICKRLVELMGGRIEVTSEPGEGSIFTVYMSLRVLEEETPVAFTSLDGVQALIVEGEPHATQILENYLVHAGAKVQISEADNTISQVRTSLDAGAPMVVLLDARRHPAQTDDLRERLRQAYGPAARFVLLRQGRRHSARADHDDGMTLDMNVMRRENFLNAVAAALGIESARFDSIPVDTVAVSEPISLNEAREKKQLILVAEDYEINRKVILQQLAMLGYAAEFAEDGQQALDMWRTGEYALLLTDCHMPNMDGYALTRSIRELEDSSIRMPIIAVTADALKGVCEACIAAGMDDYLTKPFKLTQLGQILEKWMPKRPSENVEEVIPDIPEAQVVADQAATDEVTGVDVNALINILGTDDPGLLSSFYADFLSSGSELVEEIESAYRDGDPVEIGRQAHKFKSSARMVGANALADCVLRLEQHGKQGNLEIEAEIAQLRVLFDQVHHWVQAYQTQIED